MNAIGTTPKVGDECVSPSFTVTEAHVMTYADLTGDHTPVHTDEAYARTTPFGTRVAHGLLGLSLADGLKTQSDIRFLPGMSLGWTWDFVGPIKLGDTVRVKFRVGSMRAIEEQTRLGHRGAAVRADQPARRSGSERRASPDGPASAGRHPRSPA